MSDYEFTLEEAQSLVRELMEAGWSPPPHEGYMTKSDYILLVAHALRPIIQTYMPAYYTEGGGP